ncbi:hypothetical protein JY651_07860 [Pyxidicoccus parkwayensis]|uniref:Uncharacterized protein n=1 Tax=Pyxidicoccus parkwayensis TaxID=2813578 RepID=A0ABX7P308_9BACT|nr:hypothetical protein [Pyxidicoccus parkwaysis]QSQ24845.1 hypothetical protein JY651_07860 [Pyxidicoccus parkwaysis]
MRLYRFAVLVVLLSTQALAQSAPSFKPAEVRKQCKQFRETVKIADDVARFGQLVDGANAETQKAIEAGDFAAARESKKQLLDSMQKLSRAYNRAIEAQIYFAQFTAHMKELPKAEMEKMVPHMTDCLFALKELDEAKSTPSEEGATADTATK